MQIFRTLIETFMLRGDPQGETVIPTGWEDGRSITFYPSPSMLVTDNRDEPPDWQEITGQVENAVLDPGNEGYYLTLRDNNEATHTVRIRPFHAFSRGDARDLPLSDLLKVGNHVQVVGFSLTSGEVLAQYIALEEENVWQTVLYHTFFDLTQHELDPALLTYYLQSGPVNVQLYGSAEQVLPLLVDEQLRVFATGNLSVTPSQQIVAYGTLQSAEPPRIVLERLFVLNGECLSLPHQAKTCFYWKLVYPPEEETIILTATVQDVIPEVGVLVLAEPVEGFVTVTLAPNGQLLTQDGTAVTWEAITPGTVVQATGEVGEAGTLLAQEIVLIETDN